MYQETLVKGICFKLKNISHIRASIVPATEDWGECVIVDPQSAVLIPALKCCGRKILPLPVCLVRCLLWLACK